ncbi:hypothetical protein [Brevundimonas aurantiaca]|uniref:hypothetical protein n=1 Tax=Brevundimonas aurantiaca TaxID=74316 RepID=UPI002FDEB42C
MIEVRYETRVICPAELDRPAPARPSLPPEAVVQANPAGAAWMAAELAYGSALAALFSDAQAACPKAGP